MRGVRGSWLATAVALAVLPGCTSSSSTPARLPGEHLTRAEFNSGPSGMTNVWPLTVDSGTLSCVEGRARGERNFGVVFTTEEGAQYALNGAAENTDRYLPGAAIYDPDVDATVLIAAGLRLCPHFPTPAWETEG